MNEILKSEYKGVVTLKNCAKYGVLPVASTALLTSNANAAIDVTAIVDGFVADGTGAITAVGTGLLTLAGIAVVFSWVKAAFFS